jgi:hypothetical protein
VHFGAEVIIIPRARRVVVIGTREILEPDFNGDQKPLGLSDFVGVEADVRLNLQRVEEQAARPDAQMVGEEAIELGFVGGHHLSRN